MKLFLKLFIGLLFAFTLTGCFGEDYDMGVPIANIKFGTYSQPVQLTEANIRWQTANENVQKTKKDIEEYASSLDEIKIGQSESVRLEFKENEKNGGDIWTDPTITAYILKDGKRTELELDDSLAFISPTEKGHYVLVVEFMSHPGSAQYVANMVIE